jgi:hypothetical protein
MSIFKETLPNFVDKQLRIREAIIKQGNNPSIANSRTKVAKGAFFTNTVHKQCVIRMMSGVDIIDESLLETGESKETNNLSKRFILQGGTLPYLHTSRKGFGKSGGAYGDKFIRSNAGDGYGIVPMPGIIDAEIATTTAYGSLRQAKVNFVCHNRRQLSALEILYMRPGMPVLLEWQWSPFIDNSGKINNKHYSIEKKWFNKNATIADLYQEIINTKTSSGGNYDGFVGFCKNFNIVSRPDGGYDCTTELMGGAEILEGLKARREGYTKTVDVFTNSEGVEEAYSAEDIAANLNEVELDNMELILEGLLELSDMNYDSGMAEGSNLTGYVINSSGNAVKKSAIVNPKGSSGTLLGILTNSSNSITEIDKMRSDFDTLLYENRDDKNRGEEGRATTDEEKILLKSLKEKEEALNKKLVPLFLNSITDYDYIWRGESTGEEGATLYEHKRMGQMNRYHTYISWREFVRLINLLVFPHPDSNNTDDPLTKLVTTYNIKGEGGETTEWLKIIPYTFPSNRINEKISTLLDNSFDPSVCLMPWQNKDTTTDDRKFILGSIFLNVGHMLTKYKEMAYSGDNPTENFNLYDFFDEIWKDVNTACAGHHNFVIQTDIDRSNRIRIIDLIVGNGDIKPEDLFEFKIQGNESIVRDFKYNSVIASSLSATIAIAAQAPHNVSDLDQATFANFSRGTKSRFHKESSTTSKSGTTTTPKEQYEKDEKKLLATIKKLDKYLGLMSSGEGRGFWSDGREKNKVDGTSYQEVISTAKSIKSLIFSLLSRNSTTGEKNQIVPLSRSAVVPLSFTCQLDGIGGIVIGNMFKVEKEKLPIGYQGKDIAFTVLTESQRITAGQDWITEISGQLTLLDLGTTAIKKYEDEVLLLYDKDTIESDTDTDTLLTGGNFISQQQDINDKNEPIGVIIERVLDMIMGGTFDAVSVWPVGKTPTGPHGLASRKINSTAMPVRWGRPHFGYDITGPYKPYNLLVCNLPGVVDSINTGCVKGNKTCGGGYGNHVSIKHSDNSWSFYGHLKEVHVTKGQNVGVGTVLGVEGTTGKSDGPHVHFEIRVKRPDGFTKRFGGGSPIYEVHGFDKMYPHTEIDKYFYYQSAQENGE